MNNQEKPLPKQVRLAMLAGQSTWESKAGSLVSTFDMLQEGAQVPGDLV